MLRSEILELCHDFVKILWPNLLRRLFLYDAIRLIFLAKNFTIVYLTDSVDTIECNANILNKPQGKILTNIKILPNVNKDRINRVNV
jgi:hypothetical protein